MVSNGFGAAITTAIWPKGLSNEERRASIAEHHVLCFQASDGKQLWDTVVPAGKIVVADRMIRREVVQDRSSLRSTELLDKTLGVVGVGQIGGRLIELCAPLDLRGENLTTVAEFTVAEGERIPLVLSWQPSHEPPRCPGDTRQ